MFNLFQQSFSVSWIIDILLNKKDWLKVIVFQMFEKLYLDFLHLIVKCTAYHNVKPAAVSWFWAYNHARTQGRQKPHPSLRLTELNRTLCTDRALPACFAQNSPISIEYTLGLWWSIQRNS